ncbi:MAG: hypothetical protein ACI97A_001190 [Planctomycetota bacterium]|jgi:hypothetical protein
MMKNHFSILAVICFLLSPSFGQQVELKVAQSLAPDAAISAYEVLSSGQGKQGELVVFEVGGKVRQFRATAAGGFVEFSGELVLEDAERCVFCTAKESPSDDLKSLFALTPKGLFVYGRNDKGQFLAKGKRLVRKARFRLRVGGPRRANILQDVNGDKVLDLVAPGQDSCEVWLRGAEGYRKTARVNVKVRVDQSTGKDIGDDRFFQSIRVPDLDVRDMNGDGRDDIVIMRGSQTRIHRQKEDGTIPFDPDVVLELDKFVDTSPKATVRPGRTLAGTEKAKLLIRDLNKDKIPDYVISHRRKVWVIHGTKDGPQFTKPTKILKTSDDITFIWLANLGDDDFADLLVMRVEVPTVGTIISGIFGSIDISMRGLGYESLDGNEFASKPKWKNEITIKLPSLGEIMRNPEALIKRFEEAADSFRASLFADVNGDKRSDLVLLDKDTTRAEIWEGREGDAPDSGANIDVLVKEVFFDEKDAEWDLDRIFGWIEGLGNSQATRWTQGRKSDRVLPFRKDEVHIPLEVLHGDFNGDGQEELVVVYRVLGKRNARRFDLISWN